MNKQDKNFLFIVAAVVIIALVILAAVLANIRTIRLHPNLTMCGSFSTFGGGGFFPDNSTALASGRCFLNAYMTDAPANLHFSQSSVDTGFSYNITIVALGFIKPERIFVMEQDRVDVMAPRNYTYYCRSVTEVNSTNTFVVFNGTTQTNNTFETTALNITGCTNRYFSFIYIPISRHQINSTG